MEPQTNTFNIEMMCAENMFSYGTSVVVVSVSYGHISS